MRDLGDYQTPPALVSLVADALRHAGISWRRVLEPTCGVGNFLVSLAAAEETTEVKGVELQHTHALQVNGRLSKAMRGRPFEIIEGSLFDLDLRKLTWLSEGPTLVVGNPPWVTNAELGALRSSNLPRKSNVKLLSGLDAITGAANFDLTEFIWIKILEELQGSSSTVALLCKTQVARNVLGYARDRQLGVAGAWMWRIDASSWFGASVDACLLSIALDPKGKPVDRISVFADISSRDPESTLGFVDDQLVNHSTDLETLSAFVGQSSLEWRQGVKHDAARVMELTAEEGELRNGLGETVRVEPDFVFPLVKGSDLFHGRTRGEASRFVIVPQRRLGEDTAALKRRAPRLWHYLERHSAVLDGRKSSIYRSQPRFSVFGIEPYAFAPYKVAVSGLHKEARFRLLGPVDSCPVMLDDTCYFLAFEAALSAAMATATLNSALAQAVLDILVFKDAKRPIKKQVLRRVDVRALLGALDSGEAIQHAEKHLDDAGLSHGVLHWPADLGQVLPDLPLFQHTA